MEYLKSHYDTEGPFGIPMKDSQAKRLESLMLKDASLKRVTLAQAPAELLPGERADISWITTESVDRDQEVVLSKGMDDSHFRMNPIVTLQHAYYMPPVGKSVWRKKSSDGDMKGIKAKTQYPKKPSSWNQQEDWPPDVTFTLIQSGLLLGKSIGFICTKHHQPTDEELKKNPQWEGARRIIDEWLLLEYACVYLPCQQDAVVEAVSKGAYIPDALAELFKIPKEWLATPTVIVEKQEVKPIPFLAWEEIEKSIKRQINNYDFEATARKSIQDGIDRERKGLMLTLINILILSTTIESYATTESLDDLYRFPDHTTVTNARLFYFALKDNIDKRYTGHTQDDELLDTILEEANALYEVWDTLDSAQSHYFEDTRRLEELKKLRLLLGEEAWMRGLMPPPVPVWRFKKIE